MMSLRALLRQTLPCVVILFFYTPISRFSVFRCAPRVWRRGDLARVCSPYSLGLQRARAKAPNRRYVELPPHLGGIPARNRRT